MDTKKCGVCSEELPVYKFAKRKASKDGLQTQCKPCNNEGRKHRMRTDKRIFLGYKYRMMNRRVSTRHKDSHLYEGLPIMSKDEFISKSISDPDFNRLFDEWNDLGWELTKVPSPDRVNSSLGYLWDNIEWVTWSMNSRRGSESRHNLV